MNKEDLNVLKNDTELCEALADVFYEEFVSDDEIPFKKGRYLIKAFLKNSVDDALIALCGWSLETLIEKAKERIKEEGAEE